MFSPGADLTRKNISYHSIIMEPLLADPQHGDWLPIHKLMEEGIKVKAVRPLKVEVYESYQLQQAFTSAFEVQDAKVIVKVPPLIYS